MLISHVNTQYARRDIFIFDADFYEFVRKKISFKQNKNGFSIKNKNFSIKNEAIVNFTEDSEIALLCNHPHVAQHHPVVETPAINTPPPSLNNEAFIQPKQKRIIKHVIFSPMTIEERQKFPYKFGYGKRYPVFSEKIIKNGIGSIIETIDDLGNTVSVPDEHFVSADINLIGDRDSDFSQKGKSLNDDRLNWAGVIKDNNVPKLR